MTRQFHSAIGRIRAGRLPAAHGGATPLCQARKVVGEETVKSTASVISLVPPALIRQGAALGLALMLAGPVAAHSWYDPTCCSDKDCAPIPADTVQATPKGWHVRLEQGDHPLVKHTIDVVIPYGSEDVLRSDDEQFHACVSMGSPTTDPTVLCLYVTGSGA